MKKLNLSALAMLFVFLLTGFTAKAQTIDILFGETYQVAEYQAFHGTFTLTTDGTLTVYNYPSLTTNGFLSTDANGDYDIDEDELTVADDRAYQTFTYNLEAGTYYYHLWSAMSATAYRFAFEAAGGNTPGAGATAVVFGNTYTVNAGASFNGTITLTEESNLAVTVTGDGGSLFDSDEEWIAFTDVNWADDVTRTMTFANLAAGTYTYKAPEVSEESTYVFELVDDVTSGGGNTGDDDNTIVMGKLYENVTSFDKTFEAITAGTLTVTGSPSIDGSLMNSNGVEIDMSGNIQYTDEGQVATYELTAGTYQYYLGFAFDPITLKFEYSGETAGGNDGPSTGVGVLELNKTYTVASGESVELTFVPSETGTLYATFTEGGEAIAAPIWGSLLYSDASYDNPIDPVNSEAGVTEYSVTKGETYYILANTSGSPVYYAYEVTFSMEEAGEVPPVEIPEGYTALEPGSTYTATGVGTVKLYFTPEANGTLTVIQAGDYDSHLYSDVPVYSDDYGYENNMAIMIPSDGYKEVDGGYELPYALTAGKTYFIVAKRSTGDGVTTLTYNWKADGVTENIIELDYLYTFRASDPVYTYIADADGILSAQWSSLRADTNAYAGEIAVGQQQFFMYTSEACAEGTEVAPLSVGDGDGSGYLVKFQVKKGDIYYVHLKQGTFNCIFTFEESEAIAAITNIEPVPGNAYDVTNFRYYWNMQFSPNNATTEGLVLAYVPKGETESTTIDVNGVIEMGGDAFRIPATELVNLIENDGVEPGTLVTYTFTGLKAGGEYVNTNLMEEGKEYVTIGENGQVSISFSVGGALTVEATDIPSEIYQKSEAGQQVATITYSAPIASVSEVTVIEGRVVQGGQSAGDDAPASITVPDDNISINGNTLKIDLGGVDMTTIPAGSVTLWVAGVKGENGLYADYGGNSVGTYYITLVAGTFSGVDIITSEDGVYNVYNLNGVRVLSTENAADLLNLDKGIYIVNGKKFVR